ncbi:MAG TPA: NAD(P)H-dependent oxidoreductase [Rhizobiaceae bacterium]|nr:NAD(P)H-dependent oxidoreductase [Rhizobiaceae bacterium]
MLNIVGFSGSPRRPSKTRTLVEAATDAISTIVPAQSIIFDLVDLGPSIGTACRLEDLDGKALTLAERIQQADILVVGSPIYKASYAGMFKHFFDLLPPESLRDKLVCLTATGGSHRHALAIEQHMRPLFAFFCAVSLPTVIFASDDDFDNGSLHSANVRDRLRAAASEARRLASSVTLASAGSRVILGETAASPKSLFVPKHPEREGIST